MDEGKTDGVASIITLAALGIIAYVFETTLHEAGGHGSLCLLSGGQITLLAPLYMRCSVVTPQMVAAGPAMNFLAGLLSLIVLQLRRRSDTVQFFVWLSFIFNWLVAAGYLMVGAATGFGDWGVVFAGVKPDLYWRLPAGLAALLSYIATINIAGRLFRRVAGAPTTSVLRRLVLVPTGAAAAIALAAEIYGQGAQPLGLALAVGCTLVPGLTLLGIGDGATVADGPLRIGPNWILAGLAALIGAGFILIIGPGADLSGI